MIGRLTGRLIDCSPGQALLDVGGVGYEVSIPLSTFYKLTEVAVTVTLYVHTHAREDALQLFGFASDAERSAFRRLIGISGVGPRLALAILSGIPVDELVRAVTTQDRVRLQKIPGVGRKTAERVLLELKDRLGFEAGSAAPGATPGAAAADDGPRDDAVSALCNLGYSREAAERAVDTALADTGNTATLELVLRSALGRLVGSG